MDKDQLAALDRAATQGVWSVCTDAVGDTFVASMTDSAETVCDFGAACDDEMQESIDADAALIVGLVNAYRTGKLVLIGPDAVDDVAAVIEQGMWSPASGPVEWTPAGITAMKEQCLRLATAALAALGVK